MLGDSVYEDNSWRLLTDRTKKITNRKHVPSLNELQWSDNFSWYTSTGHTSTGKGEVHVIFYRTHLDIGYIGKLCFQHGPFVKVCFFITCIKDNINWRVTREKWSGHWFFLWWPNQFLLLIFSEVEKSSSQKALNGAVGRI